MVRRPRVASAITAALALGIAMTGAVKAAPPDIFTEHFTWADQYVGIGCYEPVLITEEGSAVIHVTETEDWFTFSGSFRISGSWTEDTDGDPTTPDEVFAGGIASAPLNARITPSGAGGFTDIFTATVKGDEGTRGVFRYRAHLTVNAKGDVTVDFERFAGECRSR